MDSTKNAGKGMDRRDFIKGTAAGAIGLATVSTLSTSVQAETLKVENVKRWDDATDVVIIGSGFASLAAAIEARLAGAKVLIIEKMPVIGGNSIINGGAFSAAATKFQKEAGIEDSAELMLQDMLRAGLYLNHVGKAKLVAEKSNEALVWCLDFLGAQFTRLTYHGGHSVKRTIGTYNSSGSELINKMLAKAKELKVGIQTRTKLEQFVKNKEGRIVGIQVKKGYKFPDEKQGKLAFIKANRAVILATDGIIHAG